METDFTELSAALEEEAANARAIAETLRLLHAASCGCKNTGVGFGDVQNALWHLWEMTDRHADRLNRLNRRGGAALTE